jgi:ethanolamine utilization protein EutQ (cupin superfamily)
MSVPGGGRIDEQEGSRGTLGSLGFGCDVWTDPPDQVWADFVHDVDEIVMLIEGEIEVSFAGKTLRPGPGEEIVIPAGASHTSRNTGKTNEPLVLRLPPGITDGATTVRGTGGVTFGKNAL